MLRVTRKPTVGLTARALYLHNAFTNKRAYTSSVYQRPVQKWVDSVSRIQISAEVQSAILENKPVVALESTIYTHGFPYPDNVALSLSLESIVRKNGGIPATIGIVGGMAKVGLSADELLLIAESAGKPDTMKISRKDLPYILGLGIAGRKLNGGTTVSATMMLAHVAGISVFGTGGLGGVHRGGQDTMDVSADLTELGRTPVAVVSSGCKSFLDIPRTLEYLETQGAGVYTFADGRTGDIDFPAFYTRESGVKSQMIVQDAKEAAAILVSQLNFDPRMRSGLLFANPIPEEFAIPKAEIDIAINQAVQEAADQGIHGHANTPFILARIKDLTKGNSIPANRALIQSNVTMATKLAVEFAKYKLSDVEEPSRTAPMPVVRRVEVSLPPLQESKKLVDDDFKVLIFGSVAVDLCCDLIPSPAKTGEGKGPDTLQMHTSNISSITSSIGGVGHNVALASHLILGNLATRLCSIVGEDLPGSTILTALQNSGLSTASILKLPNHNTAQYVALNDTKKDLAVAMADMSLISLTTPPVRSHFLSIPSPQSLKWVVVDANLHPSLALEIFAKYTATGHKTAFEPVSVAKSGRIFTTSGTSSSTLKSFPDNTISMAAPNQYELAAMYAAAKSAGYLESKEWWSVIDALGIPSSGARTKFVHITNEELTDAGVPLQSVQLLPFIPTILTKLGSQGVLLTQLLKPDDSRLTDREHAPFILSRGEGDVGGVYMRLYPANTVNEEEVVSVNAVGDTFLGVLVAGLAKGAELSESLIMVAQKAAGMTLRSKGGVSPKLWMLRTVVPGHKSGGEESLKQIEESGEGFEAERSEAVHHDYVAPWNPLM